jgi:hypothetical protein
MQISINERRDDGTRLFAYFERHVPLGSGQNCAGVRGRVKRLILLNLLRRCLGKT